MKRINSLISLINAANDKRAVISFSHVAIRNPKPAAFIVGWNGRMIQNAIDLGLYIYERKK